MEMRHLDWLPVRFWLTAAGCVSILILGLLAVGAIDVDGENRHVAAVSIPGSDIDVALRHASSPRAPGATPAR
jgi:hypothetical protein